MKTKQAKIQVFRTPYEGVVDLKFDYAPVIINTIKPIPGARWNPKKLTWSFPAEMLHTLGGEYNPTSSVQTIQVPNGKLYEFQQNDVSRFQNCKRFMLFYEMGLGKTPTTINILQMKYRNKPQKMLFVCPAMVRLDIQDMFDTWWPTHPEIEVIESGTQVEKAKDSNLVICSYELMSKLPKIKWDSIIFDEVHNLKTYSANRTKAAKKLVDGNPNANLIGLSGTPITNDPKDLFNPLNIFWPGRFGTYNKFCTRYCKSEPNEYSYSGKSFFSLNEEHSKELEQRLASVSSRHTKKDVAELLPSILVSTKRYGINESKITFVLSQVQNMIDNGASHICILTHTKELGEKLEKELGHAFNKIGYATSFVSGNETPPKRHKEIQKAKGQKKAILVATMHSVMVGIDLTKFNHALFAELYWSPAVMTQTIGRFHRLSSMEPCNVSLCVMGGSEDEKIAMVLQRKIEDIGKLIKQGKTEGDLSDAFELSKEEEQDMMNDLLEMTK
jgi:SNF2 family DNA or RNA helicase